MAGQLVRQFVTACTLTFKNFEFDVTMSEGKATLWNFTAKSRRNEKHYAIYCAPSLKKVKNLIKIAMKKLPQDHRLVVVCKEHSDEDLDKANEQNYCLLTMDILAKYGQEMIDIREREAMAAQGEKTDEDLLDESGPTIVTIEEDRDSMVDQVIQKDRLF